MKEHTFIYVRARTASSLFCRCQWCIVPQSLTNNHILLFCKQKIKIICLKVTHRWTTCSCNSEWLIQPTLTQLYQSSHLYNFTSSYKLSIGRIKRKWTFRGSWGLWEVCFETVHSTGCKDCTDHVRINSYTPVWTAKKKGLIKILKRLFFRSWRSGFKKHSIQFHAHKKKSLS